MSDLPLPTPVVKLLRDGVSPVCHDSVRNAVRLVARSVHQNGGTFAAFLEVMTRPGFALARQYAEVTAQGRRLHPARLRSELAAEWLYGRRGIDSVSSNVPVGVRPAPRV